MRKQNGLLLIVAAAAVGTSVANAQTNCNGLNGPDVIVGDIQGVANYSTDGTNDAYAIGTYSCNIGNVWLNWIAETNQHPVIAMNIFKYRTQAAGYSTFEQLGQSWLKHGFFALSNTLCCSGCQSTNGDHLGVRCSDPYTATRNGTQNGNGPKWQVNAHTGVFTYPPAQPAFTGSTARRIKAKLNELEASNTTTIRYFVDAQYIAADDAAAGNDDNNTSYREVSMSVTGTPPNVTNSSIALTAATTVREQVALYAWKAIDPAVTITVMDIPGASLGTERVYVGSKATQINATTWHYEYAVYNQNSDRSIGSFSVPVAAGVTVTNAGFRDVDYNDGDGIGNVNISGEDWRFTRSTNAATWNTDAFASNANGNAIRWGTMYNFRFDANVAPGPNSNVTLGLWKTAGSANGLAQVPGTPPAACYANCDGSTATPCLNVSDFSCFLNAFASGASYANCDGSTTVPVLNIQDFACFLNSFAAGCSGC
jgi:hypothetical protein